MTSILLYDGKKELLLINLIHAAVLVCKLTLVIKLKLIKYPFTFLCIIHNSHTQNSVA